MIIQNTLRREDQKLIFFYWVSPLQQRFPLSIDGKIITLNVVGIYSFSGLAREKKTCWSFFWKLLLRWKSLDRYPEEKLIHAVLEKWEIQHPAESKLFDFFDMQVSQKQVFRQKNFSELVCCFQLMKAQNEDKNHWDKKKKV